jgi:acetyltransferase-like isoleucine patch superfamily enzyme
MFRKFMKTKVSDIAEISELGLKISWSPTLQIREAVSFEAPVAISNAIFSGRCIIGYLSSIRRGCHFSGTDIGRYCSVAPNAFVGGGEHPLDWLSTHGFQYANGSMFGDDEKFVSLAGQKRFTQPKGRVQIGHDVWLGEGVHISRGVNIGHGAVVAARSVVTADIAPYAIVAGVPAKPLRFRFTKEIIDSLLRLKWWDYDLAPVARRIDYSNIHKAIETLENAIDTHKIHKLDTRLQTLTRKNKEFIVS